MFLDKDGTINKYIEFMRRTEIMELLSAAAESIKLINKTDYLAAVVTNQSVIARSEVTWNGLEEIHKQGAYIDVL